jgi:hypothetical protein
MIETPALKGRRSVRSWLPPNHRVSTLDCKGNRLETQTFWENPNAPPLGKSLVDMTKCFLLIDERKTFEVSSINTTGAQFGCLFSNPTRTLSTLTSEFALYFQFGV